MKSDNIIVSVVIPVYNAEQFLRRTLDCVLEQTLHEIEVICIDDGSSDNSLNILEEYAQRDERVRVVKQVNSGAAVARNRGLELSHGKYLSFLDSDDFFEDTMLETAYQLAEDNDADIAVFGCDNYFEKNSEYTPCVWSIRSQLLPNEPVFAGTDIPKDVFKCFVGWAWDKLISRSLIDTWNLRFQEQRTSNDLLFVFSAIVAAKRIVVTREVLAHHQREVGGLSVTREKSWQCFYRALTALRDRLREWGLFEQLEQDFINYSLHFSLWNLDTLAAPTHGILLEKLKTEWFSSLGITAHDADYFYNKGEYAHYLEIMQG